MVSNLKLYLNVDCKNTIDAPIYEVIHQNKDLKLRVFKYLYNSGYNPILSVGFTRPYLNKDEWKRPYCEGWSQFAERRMTKEEFEKQCELLEKNPYYNIGLITKWNGLVVYDIDSFEYADTIEEAYKRTFGTEPVNDTYIEKSKKGFKIYFRVVDLPPNAGTNKLIPPNRGRKELSRYCGLYVVCFPSIHPESEDGNVIVYMPVVDLEKLKEKLPEAEEGDITKILESVMRFKEITYEQMLEFEANIKELLGIKDEGESDYEFKDIEFTPISDRAPISGDIIEDTAQALAKVVEPLWVEGQRWAVVLALSYFFARLTKVSSDDASKIIYRMAELLNTEEKRVKELSKKVYNAYRRMEKGLNIAYKTFLRDCGLPEEKINEFKNAIIKTFITTLKDLCNIRYATTKFYAIIPIIIKEKLKKDDKKDGEDEKADTFVEKEIGEIRMEKTHANKYLLTFVNNDGVEVGKKLVTVRQMYDERTYTPILRRLGVSKDEAPIIAIELINQLTAKHREFINRMKSLAASEVYAMLDGLNEELQDHGLEIITQEDIDSLFEYDEESDKLNLSFPAFGDLMIRIFHSVVTIETGEIFIYVNGIYKNNEVSEFTIEYVIRKLAEVIATVVGKEEAKEMITTRFISEVLAYVKDMSPRVSYNDFNDYSRYIPLENGVFDLEEEKLLPHSPQYLFTFKLPVEYNPDAECPNIEKFINSIVKPEDVDLLWKIIAYTLIPGQPYQCWFILVGRGSNGKSTYLNLIEKFLGSENVSHVPLQTLEKEKFSRVQVVGKLANIYADLPKDALESTGFIKAFTGEDALYIEPKYKRGFSYKPNSKLIFSANELPTIYDESEGFWRRVILIEFPYTFDRDPKLFDRLATKEEMSGLFNQVVKYIKKLKEEGLPTSTEIKEMWLRKSSPLIAFVREHIEEDETGMVRKDELYKAYKAFCRKYNINNKYLIKGGYELFFRDIKDLLDRMGVKYEEQKLSFDDGRKRVLVNITLTNMDILKEFLDEGNNDNDNTKDNKNNDNNDNNNCETKEYNEQYDIDDDELTSTERKILEVMDSEDKEWTTIELAEKLNMSEDEIERAMNKLIALGEVYSPKPGKYRRL